jgi:hypothetical protein
VTGSGRPVAQRTPLVAVAKRESRPQGRSSTPGGIGRARNGRTLKGSKAYERMNLFAQASRGRRTVETASSDGNAEGTAGVGNQYTPRAGRIQHSEKQPTSREAAPPMATSTGHHSLWQIREVIYSEESGEARLRPSQLAYSMPPRKPPSEQPRSRNTWSCAFASSGAGGFSAQTSDRRVSTRFVCLVASGSLLTSNAVGRGFKSRRAHPKIALVAQW